MQLGRNLFMDLEDASSKAKFLIRDRDSKFAAVFDALMTDAGLKVVSTGIRIPRMNSLRERWTDLPQGTPVYCWRRCVTRAWRAREEMFGERSQ
ncbi:hypothetical protein ACFYOY_48725 [Streptomyces sp. NPDC007875]|uniref:hypothetical protein n=1 Tax=Streptomyces sp. NPDC007875 TaxID=3364783 RepID=UPI0036A6408C